MSNNEDTVTLSVDARLASMVDELVSLRSENARLRGVIAAQNKVTMAATDELEALRVYARIQSARNAEIVTVNKVIRERDEARALLEETIVYVEECEQYHKPQCRTLSKRIKALLEGGAK